MTDIEDRLAAELLGEVPRLVNLAARVFAVANNAATLGPRRDFERIGMRLTDLVTAIGSLARP